MAVPVFRNRRGELVELQLIPATRAQSEFGALLDTALAQGAVAITKHATPRAVLMSYAEFESLMGSQSPSLTALGAQFDSLLERMQGVEARAAASRAFEASPRELGRAAVKAARKKRLRVAK